MMKRFYRVDPAFLIAAPTVVSNWTPDRNDVAVFTLLDRPLALCSRPDAELGAKLTVTRVALRAREALANGESVILIEPNTIWDEREIDEYVARSRGEYQGRL
jgi:hypothetical protein